jgi:hypothetical protein
MDVLYSAPTITPAPIFIMKNIQLERRWLQTLFKGIFIDYAIDNPPHFFLKHCEALSNNPELQPNLILGKELCKLNDFRVFLKKILDVFLKKNIKIIFIQLGDEMSEKLFFEFYEHPAISKIIRNYCYPYTLKDIPKGALDKIYIFPLGTFQFNQEETTPSFQERSIIWSFIGRRYYGREYELSHYQHIQPSFCFIINDFLSSDALGPKDYQSYLKKTKFIPTVCGCNPETFRFYEALEFGAIPFYVRQPYDEIYWTFLKILFPDLLEISSLQQAASILSSPTSYKSTEEWEEYRLALYKRFQYIKANPLVKLTDIFDYSTYSTTFITNMG